MESSVQKKAKGKSTQPNQNYNQSQNQQSPQSTHIIAYNTQFEGVQPNK